MGILRRGGKAGKVGKAAKQATRYWGIAPSQPTITQVTRVGVSYLSGDYDVYFVPGTGVGATASSFTITANNPSYGDRTFTATSSPYRVTGLRSGATWTFKIKANATIGQTETAVVSPEADGGSQDVIGLPGKPSAPSASSPSSVSYDTISWGAPENGGSAIIDYQWESNDGKSGTVSGTSTNVSQEAGTAQAYRVRARNAEGYGEWSDYSSSTTTFSFVPFSVFGFSPFGVFGFSPFGVFGFSPFGFSPFGVFGFSPFGVFGFSPFGFSSFGVFGFSPFAFSGCINEDTLIPTVGPDNTWVKKAAKDVEPGDEVWSVTFSELVDEDVLNPEDWSATTLGNMTITRTSVVSKVLSQKTSVMTINNDPSKKYSLVQPVLTKRNGTYFFMHTGAIEVGDAVIEYSYTNDTFTETPVTSVEVIEADSTTYRFDCEGTDTYIAGDLVMHNLRKY